MDSDAVSGKIKTIFQRYDTDGNGTISKEELQQVIQKLGKFSGGDIDAIFAQMDTNKDGMVQYQEFVDWVFNEQTLSNSNANADKIQAAIRACVDGVGSIGTLMDEMGIDIALDGEEADFVDVVASLEGLSNKQLRDVFQGADIDKSGNLQLGEIQSMLFPWATSVTGTDALTVAKVFAQMDRNNDGKITCAEFISYILERKKRLATAPTDADKRHIAAAFCDADRNSNGNIMLADLERFLCCTTEQEKEIARRCFLAVDKNSDGTLSVAEFSRIYGKELVQETKGIEVEWKEVPEEPDSEEEED
mmetsp:Transcript_65916/g.141065  ORF Transcript_65916/g.141065 Transcript_65916/m.141065 type:complete len:305 (-) Transcript_65916:84-998(-)